MPTVTALCGGGTSSAQSGAVANIIFDSTLIAEGLGIISPWLLPFSALIAAFTYEVTVECATDPPAMPVFDASDITNLIGGILNPNLSVTLAKINDALLNWAWPTYCKCDNATVVPPAPPVAIPPGISLQGGQTLQPCFNGSISGVYPGTTSLVQYSAYTDVTQQLLPVTGARHTLTDGSGSYTIYGIPPGAQQIQIQLQTPHWANCPTIACGQVGFRTWDAGFNLVHNGSLTTSCVLGPCSAIINEPAAHPTAVWWNAAVQFLIGTGCTNCDNPIQLSTQVFCGGNLGDLQSCCPPDPSVMTGIQNILDALTFLISATDSPIGGYVNGTVHGPLVGTGSFALVGPAAALKIHFDAFPTGTSVNPGTPDFYWDAGFITPITSSGPFRSTRVTFQDQIVTIPKAAGSVGYTLLHGSTIHATELFPA